MDTNVLYIEHYIDLHNYISDKIYELDEEVVYTEGMKEWFGAVGDKVKKVGESIKNFGILLLKQLQKIWHFLTKWFTIGKCKKTQLAIKTYLEDIYKNQENNERKQKIDPNNNIEIKKAIEQIIQKKSYQSLELESKDINFIINMINKYAKKMENGFTNNEIQDEFSLFINTDPIELEKIINKINDIYKYLILITFRNKKELYEYMNRNDLVKALTKSRISVSEDIKQYINQTSQYIKQYGDTKDEIFYNKVKKIKKPETLKTERKYDSLQIGDKNQINKNDAQESKIEEFKILTNKIIDIFKDNKLPNKNILNEINKILNNKKIEKLDEISNDDLNKFFNKLQESYNIDKRLIMLFKNIKIILKFIMNYPKTLDLMFDIIQTKSVKKQLLMLPAPGPKSSTDNSESQESESKDNK